MKGIVKWFDSRKGYGFIHGEDGVDIYVHFSHSDSDGFRTLKHNWRVEYDAIISDDGRPEARNVKIFR